MREKYIMSKKIRIIWYYTPYITPVMSAHNDKSRKGNVVEIKPKYYQ